MNLLKISPEGWRTMRVAIRGGWGPTMRLVMILTVAAVASITSMSVLLQIAN